MDIKSILGELVTDTTENPKYTPEEVQEAIDELNGKEAKIQELTQQVDNTTKQLESKSKEYDELKNRIVDQLFNNGGMPKPDDKKPEKKEKTFDSLIKPDFRIRK